MSRRFSFRVAALCFAYFLGAGFGHSAWAMSPSHPPVNSNQAAAGLWVSDYAAAMTAAERQGKMLVIFFSGPAGSDLSRQFETRTMADPALRSRLQQTVAVKVPLDARIQVEGQSVTLVEHPAYAALERQPGIAVIDLAHRGSPYYGRVVKCFPLAEDRQYAPEDFDATLNPANSAKPAVQTATADPAPAPATVWLTDYAEALEAARSQEKLLLVYFTAEDPRSKEFERQTLADPQIAAKMQALVNVKLPLDAKLASDRGEVELLQQPAFAEMRGLPGVAILDFAHKDAPYYGCVVSTFPLLPQLSFTPREMAVILDLPPGTLTQRTLIYAVRIHPERPASANGTLDPNLVGEALSSADYQARIGRQGHHFWETRFHRINRLLPFGLLASEVCAESWPGEGLLQAAIECVRCWRLSPGHWNAVRQPHQVYGYDMKRGTNGIWYATGIFGKQERY